MKDETPKGFCHCGCGNMTNTLTRNDSNKGHVKGEYRKYLPNHNRRVLCGPRNSNWQGGTRHDKDGYVLVMKKTHPRSDANGYVFEHILVVETILGKSIPLYVEIHHVDGNKANNTPSNLVVCQDHGFHMLLHRRQKALIACGNANWRECRFCHQYDDPVNLTIYGRRAQHKACDTNYNRKRRVIRRGTINV